MGFEIYSYSFSVEDRPAWDNDKLVRPCMLVLVSSSGTLQQMVTGEVLHETVVSVACDMAQQRKRGQKYRDRLINLYFINTSV